MLFSTAVDTGFWSQPGRRRCVHNVVPGQPSEPLPGKGSGPNRILDASPGFLEQTILQTRELGFDVGGLDEVRRHLY
jgi:hypothetical protein